MVTYDFWSITNQTVLGLIHEQNNNSIAHNIVMKAEF